MSFKRLLMAGLFAAAAVAAWHASQPTPVLADGIVTAEAAQPGKVRSAIGNFGSRVVSRPVRAAVRKTERKLYALTPAIKATKGPGQLRAKNVSKKILAIDSASVLSLESGRPVQAIKHAINARQYLDLIKDDVSEELAAR